MCLYTKKSKPDKANKPITCYKRLYELDNDKYISQFQETDYSSYINGCMDFVDTGRKALETSHFNTDLYIIESGYVHSYKHKPPLLYNACDVLAEKTLFTESKYFKDDVRLYTNMRVFECVIPTDTLYCSNIDIVEESDEVLDDNVQYASERIRFVKDVTCDVYALIAHIHDETEHLTIQEFTKKYGHIACFCKKMYLEIRHFITGYYLKR